MIPYTAIHEDDFEHVVLFDGTDARPLGRYLAADPETPQSPKPKPEWRESLSVKMLQAYREHGPQSARQLAERLGEEIRDIQARIGPLVTRGWLVHVRNQVRPGGRVFAREWESVYGLCDDRKGREMKTGAAAVLTADGDVD